MASVVRLAPAWQVVTQGLSAGRAWSAGTPGTSRAARTPRDRRPEWSQWPTGKSQSEVNQKLKFYFYTGSWITLANILASAHTTEAVGHRLHVVGSVSSLWIMTHSCHTIITSFHLLIAVLLHVTCCLIIQKRMDGQSVSFKITEPRLNLKGVKL